MSFEQVLQPAIDLAENAFPISEDRARMIANAERIRKYPSTVKIYLPNGEAPKPAEIFKNPRSTSQSTLVMKNGKPFV